LLKNALGLLVHVGLVGQQDNVANRDGAGVHRIAHCADQLELAHAVAGDVIQVALNLRHARQAEHGHQQRQNHDQAAPQAHPGPNFHICECHFSSPD
jgi:hypothetical protein